MSPEQLARLSEKNLLSWLKNYVAKNPVPVIKKMKSAWGLLCLDAVKREFYLLPFNRTYNRSRSVLLGKDVNDREIYAMVQDAWSLYVGILFHSEGVPILGQFANMIAVSMSSIEAWRTGKTRERSGLSQLIKYCLEYEEASLLEAAIGGNSIGAIFTLKAHFGYNDNQAGQTFNIRREEPPTLTQAEIQRRIESMEEEQNNDDNQN